MTGFEAFFTDEGYLVVAVVTRKEFLASVVLTTSLYDGQWVCNALTFNLSLSFPSVARLIGLTVCMSVRHSFSKRIAPRPAVKGSGD